MFFLKMQEHNAYNAGCDSGGFAYFSATACWWKAPWLKAIIVI